MKIKFFQKLVCVLVLSMFIAGCASPQSTSPSQTNESLTVWVADPAMAETHFAYAMEQFRQSHPGMEVRFAEAPAPHYRFDPEYAAYTASTLPKYAEELRAQLAEGGGPDLILFNARTFPNLEKTIREGAFAPLDGFIEGDESFCTGADGQPESYNPAVLAAGVYGGKQYFIPWSYQMPMVTAAADTFRQYGLPVGEPVRHTDLLDAMRRAGESGTDLRLSRDDFQGCVQFVQWDGVLQADFYGKSMEIDRDRLQALEEQYLALRSCRGWSYSTQTYSVDVADGTLFGELAGETVFPVIGAPLIHHSSDVNVVPLLNAEGEIAVSLEWGMAVNAHSPNQQNAYDFLKLAMQSEGYLPEEPAVVCCGIPANQAAMEKWIGYCRGYNVTDEAGEFPTKALPEEYFQKLRDWQVNVGRVYLDTGLDGQMWEWFKPYYTSSADFDSCYQAMRGELKKWVKE